MTKDEALRLALEALKQIDEAMPFPVAKLAQKVIKEALAQPEQEPVAWIWEKEDGYTSIETHNLDDEDMKNVGVKSIKPLYAKPQFIGLTEDEILLISADCASSHQHMDIQFAKAIEAKLKAKNT